MVQGAREFDQDMPQVRQEDAVKSLLKGALIGTLIGLRYAPYSTRMRRVNATRYVTILSEGLHLRARAGGRLYAVDLWREHGNR